jgi:hypothetical protein
VFGHGEEGVCNAWVTKIQALLSADVKRPKSLLVSMPPIARTISRVSPPLTAFETYPAEVFPLDSFGHNKKACDLSSYASSQDCLEGGC